MEQIAYEYRNCPVPGGGFVTGFVFHEREQVCYARTDIGGMYRRDFAQKRWLPLNDAATGEHSEDTYPLSMAVDKERPERLFVVCGKPEGNGYLLLSENYGQSYVKKPLSCPVHGNRPGRSTGERLLFDNGVLYFASQTAGLMRSADMGDSWESIPVFQEYNLTFLWKKEDVIVAGSNGAGAPRAENVRGEALFVSYDAGESWSVLPMPEPVYVEAAQVMGFVPQRCCFDGEYLYVTFTATEGWHYQGMDCYSCDTGQCLDGRVWRYLLRNGSFAAPEDVTPYGGRIDVSGYTVEQYWQLDLLRAPELRRGEDAGGRWMSGGFSGIDYRDGMLVCTTIGIKGPDVVFASTNHGQSWHPILCGLAIGRMNIDVPYMKPEYNSNGSIVHWMADIKINPHNTGEAFITTGTGIFSIRNLRAALDSLCRVSREAIMPEWYSDSNGVEETVHLNVYSLPAGPVQVLDILGDLGGFAFTNLDKPCENTFADEQGRRYITCLNADFAEQQPNLVVATPRGNWVGETKGGVILSEDYGQHFVHLGYPYGLTEKIDALCDHMQQPNVNSGWVAITADAENIVWAIADRTGFLSDCVVWREHTGTWQQSKFYNQEKEALTEAVGLHIYSDRVNVNRMYAFGTGGRIFVSTDKGKTFWEKSIPEGFPGTLFESWRTSCQITVDYDTEGRLYLAVEHAGLYRLQYQSESGEFTLECLTGTGEYARCVGLGVAPSAGKSKVLYMVGRLAGSYGFYRSLDEGVGFERINTELQMYGDIRAICGDRRKYGRFFLATGSRGLLYGEPKNNF